MHASGFPAVPNPPHLEEHPLPHRLKLFAQAIVPTADWPWWAMSIHGAIATLLALFAALHPAQQFMAWGIFFDFLSGLACAHFKRGGIRARAMAAGGTTKFISFCIVVYLAGQKAFAVDVMGQQIQVGIAAAIWYGLAEWVSVAENLDELGAPLPPFMRVMLAKARETMNSITPADKPTGFFGTPKPKE